MEESVSCSRCSTFLEENDTFCNNCGFPEKGSFKEKDRYNYRIKLKKDILEDAGKKLKHVKILLYAIAGLNFLLGIYYLFSSNQTFYDGLGSLISAGIFLGCVAWVNRQPLTGILAAFIFWIVLQLFVILVDPALLIQGFLLKIVIIVIFIKGISSARDAKKFTDQLKELKAI